MKFITAPTGAFPTCSSLNPLDLSLLQVQIRKDPNFQRTGEYLRLLSGEEAKLL